MNKNNKFVYLYIKIVALLLLAGCLTGMRDPTQPPDSFLQTHTTAISTKPLELAGIFIYPNSRFAVINGQLLSEGDKVGEYVITTIRKDTVELTGPQGTMETLEIGPSVKHVTGNEGQ